MSLEKAIQHGKEHRKPYYHSKRFDRTCRNHGSCPYCAWGRQHKHKRREPLPDNTTNHHSRIRSGFFVPAIPVTLGFLEKIGKPKWKKPNDLSV